MASTPEFSLKPQFAQNWLMNGDMKIAQRGTSFASIANAVYSLDRWIYSKSGAQVHTATQDTDVPSIAQSNYAWPASLRLNLTTPNNSVGAAEYAAISQHIEGYNFANLVGAPLSLSFWVKATQTGTYCVAFRNSGLDRSYVAEYTINATNTWEYKTVTVNTGSPVAGTWNYTNGTGLQVGWTLAAGTSLRTTAGAWQTGNFIATANQVNGLNSAATDFRITGAMLNIGTSAAPFALFSKSSQEELEACLRYYEVCTGFTGHSIGVGTIEIYQRYKVQKRAAPSVFIVATCTARSSTGTPDISTGTNSFPNLVSGTLGFWSQWTGWNNSTGQAVISDRGSSDGLRAEAELL